MSTPNPRYLKKTLKKNLLSHRVSEKKGHSTESVEDPQTAEEEKDFVT